MGELTLVTSNTSVIWLELKMNRKIKKKMKPYGHDNRFQQTTQPQVHSPVFPCSPKQMLLTTICCCYYIIGNIQLWFITLRILYGNNAHCFRGRAHNNSTLNFKLNCWDNRSHMFCTSVSHLEVFIRLWWCILMSWCPRVPAHSLIKRSTQKTNEARGDLYYTLGYSTLTLQSRALNAKRR